jgi:hypothetical protein
MSFIPQMIDIKGGIYFQDSSGSFGANSLPQIKGRTFVVHDSASFEALAIGQPSHPDRRELILFMIRYDNN